MEMIKKWASCVVSFVAGVLALALSACTGMVNSATISGVSEVEKTKAFKVLTDKDLLLQAKEAGLKTEFMAMKVFSIVLMVAAVLLLVYSVVMMLKNVNVIKSESKMFAIVGLVLAVLFLVSTIGVFVSSNVYAGAIADYANGLLDTMKAYYKSLGVTLDASASVKIGVYQPVILATGIVTAGVVTAFEIKNVK